MMILSKTIGAALRVFSLTAYVLMGLVSGSQAQSNTNNSNAANEASLSLEHFAEGYQLQTPAGFAMYEFALPADVYRRVTQPDLADIRVFNANGVMVPHSIRPQPDISSSDEISHPLMIFPLSNPASTSDEQLDIRIESNGTLVQVTRNGVMGETPYTTTSNSGTHTLLVDLSQIEAPIDRLEFDFYGNSHNQLQQIQIEGSDDLDNWRTLVNSTSLAILQFEGHALQKNTAPLPTFKHKYLRITSLNDEPLTIYSIKGIETSAQANKPLQTFEAEGTFTAATNLLRFTTGGPFKLYRAQLQLPVNNMLLEGELYSRATPGSPWQFRHNGMFYQLQVQGEQLQNTAINLHGSTDPYWELRLRSSSGISANGPLPTMIFSWLPDDVVFLAQGDAPFTLAYGNGRVTNAPPPVSSLLNAMNDSQRSLFVGIATMGEPIHLQGAAALQVPNEINWLRFVLWSLLALGALLAGGMAWHLIKQMQSSTDKPL